MMARSAERESYWREQVQRQATSGTSVRQFCELAGLSEASFYAWRRELKRRDETPARPAFLPVTIEPGAALAPAGEIVLELRGGRRLHLPATLPLTALAEFIRALEASEAIR